MEKAKIVGVNFQWYHEAALRVIEEDKINDIFHKPLGTGFAYVDGLLNGGFKPGELVILSAPTKHGKSTLAQTLSWNMSQQGKTTLWFTMEMSWQELTRKFLTIDDTYQQTKKTGLEPIYYPL